VGRCSRTPTAFSGSARLPFASHRVPLAVLNLNLERSNTTLWMVVGYDNINIRFRIIRCCEISSLGKTFSDAALLGSMALPPLSFLSRQIHFCHLIALGEISLLSKLSPTFVPSPAE
jgi:hypothetical protein